VTAHVLSGKEGTEGELGVVSATVLEELIDYLVDERVIV
jgi:hypothetical protein